jgi:hypothetical protein
MPAQFAVDAGFFVGFADGPVPSPPTPVGAGVPGVAPVGGVA